MMRKSKLEFIREQGYAASDERLYSELMLQPRVVAVVAAAGLVTQQPWLFVGLGIALFGSVMTPSPAPRRFSAALGGGVALATGAALGAQLTVAAWILEAFIVVSLASVLVRRFCVPAYVYRLLTSARTDHAVTRNRISEARR